VNAIEEYAAEHQVCPLQLMQELQARGLVNDVSVLASSVCESEAARAMEEYRKEHPDQ
jgi:hypothetical protein